MLQACYVLRMANIQVKNVPEKLHNQLRRYARETGCTLREIIVEAIKREISRREWHKRFLEPPVNGASHIGGSAARGRTPAARQ
jgi:hypothetical protein